MPFFHATNSTFRVGSMLTAKARKASFASEKFLELLRPSDKASRLNSFFLSPTPELTLQVNRKHVYEVEPIDIVSRHDFMWIFQNLPYDNKRLNRKFRESIEAYWSGKSCDGDEYTDWEYLSPRIRVIRKVPEFELVGFRKEIAEDRKRYKSIYRKLFKS